MRRLRLALLLPCLLYSLPSFAQQADESIYAQALRKYVQYVQRFEKGTDTLYFEEVKGITNFFPKQIDDITISLLTGRNQVAIYEAHDGVLKQRKMSPAKVVRDEIEIGIIPYEGKLLEGRGVVLSLSKWHAVIFAFNPETRRFEYKTMENR